MACPAPLFSRDKKSPAKRPGEGSRWGRGPEGGGRLLPKDEIIFRVFAFAALEGRKHGRVDEGAMLLGDGDDVGENAGKGGVVDAPALADVALVGLVLRLQEGDYQPTGLDEGEGVGEDFFLFRPADVGSDEVDFLGQLDVKGVGALHHHHPGVVAERPGEEAVRGVHRIDFDGAALKQTINETAQVAAEVATDLARGVDPELGQRPVELFPAAADEGHGQSFPAGAGAGAGAASPAAGAGPVRGAASVSGKGAPMPAVGEPAAGAASSPPHCATFTGTGLASGSGTPQRGMPAEIWRRSCARARSTSSGLNFLSTKGASPAGSGVSAGHSGNS